jgi:hypothetical protein
MQQAPNIGTMNAYPAPLQLNAQLVQRQFARFNNTLSNKISMRTQLATACAMPLAARRHRTCFSPQIHQIVHEARRNPETP